MPQIGQGADDYIVVAEESPAIEIPSEAQMESGGPRLHESPTAIVAAAVRTEGHKCSSPKVEPDPGLSSPDEEAWLIRCSEGSYRVKYMGDTQPLVEAVGN